MNTASLELCKELYELSGWDDTEKAWVTKNAQGVGAFVGGSNWLKEQSAQAHPAYDLGYLLRKLPQGYDIDADMLRLSSPTEGAWLAYYKEMGDKPLRFSCDADTPEDATCKLAIELFKQGILTKA